MPQFVRAGVVARLVPDGVRNHWVRPRDQQVLVRVPKINVRFIVLRIFLLLPLDLRHTFLLLISCSGSLAGRFTTEQKADRGDQCNKLKLFHNYVTIPPLAALATYE